MKRDSFAVHRLAPVFASALVLAGALALSHPAHAADVDVRLNIGGAPPPPAFTFQSRPHRVYDSRSRVYVVDDPSLADYDMFQYGGYYWVFNDGYWYRSRTWRGGFSVVSPQVVPQQIYTVSTPRWKHHAHWQGRRQMSHRRRY